MTTDFEKLDRIKDLIQAGLAELERAEGKHPNWPDDIVKQTAIMVEEAGEVLREANSLCEGSGCSDRLKTEIVQTFAMCMRLWANLQEESEDDGSYGLIWRGHERNNS